MAKITRTRDQYPYGDLGYCVEWEFKDGVGCERFFNSQRAAERFALKIEMKQLDEIVAKLVQGAKSGSPEQTPINEPNG